MERLELHATRRDVTGKKVKLFRAQGKLPAVIYGRQVESMPIWLDAREARRVLRSVTTSTLLSIDVEGKKHTVLVRERQWDVIKDRLLHVDFQAISMTERVRTVVNLELVGVAPAIENYGGMLITGLETVEIEALPADLPEKITIDVSGLENIGDTIYIRDLDLPEGVEVVTDPEELIVVVSGQVPEEEEEVEAVEAEAEPEVIERGKTEEVEE